MRVFTRTQEALRHLEHQPAAGSMDRTNPESPVHTEDPRVRFAPTTNKTRGKARAGPQTAAGRPTGPTPKIAAAAGTYRTGVDAQPHVMDTTFGFQNAFSVAAPGLLARASLVNVARLLLVAHDAPHLVRVRVRLGLGLGG